jgi:hypothetical protein
VAIGRLNDSRENASRVTTIELQLRSGKVLKLKVLQTYDLIRPAFPFMRVVWLDLESLETERALVKPTGE